MFNAAHILALAIDNNHAFVNFAFYDYARYFKGTHQDIFCRHPARKGSFKSRKSIAVLLYYLMYIFSGFVYYLSGTGFGSNRLRTIRAPGGGLDDLILDEKPSPLTHESSDADQLVFFQGWNLRAYHCLEKHGDKVRDYFTPLDVYRHRVRDFIQHNRQGCDVLIGIVVRHGDYRTWLGGKHFYSLETYAGLMKQVEILMGNRKARFLVCSDEEQDTRVFTAAGIDFRFRSGHMIENLYALAECDYIVSPPSTYGMWASFYGKTPLCIIDDPSQTISTECFKVCEG